MDARNPTPGHPVFCWADLATTDDARAGDFHRRLFGWTTRTRHVGRGRFATFEANGLPMASLYRIAPRQVAAGMPSHWLPYVATPDLAGTVARAADLGADVVVAPHPVGGFARIAVIVDPTGAPLGLWQSPRPADWTAPPVSGDDPAHSPAGVER